MITEKDRQRLRALAGEQAERAAGDLNARIYADWMAHGAGSPGSRPMIRIELNTFEPEVIPALQKCEGDEARAIERRLLAATVNQALFGDDTLVPAYYGVANRMRFMAFGLPVKREHTGGLGHQFVPYLTDLRRDYGLLRPSIYGGDPEGAAREAERAHSLFGDLLPVRRISNAMGVSPTQDVVHIMSMEDMYVAMMDEPELFVRMLDRLADDYLAFFRQLADEGQLISAARDQHLCQGTYCFTDELPDMKPGAQLADLWLYADSQESAGIGASMYEELVFPAYKKLAAAFGLISYGCCEAVHALWDRCLSTLSNLRKVSISPWCDEEMMGERLRGGPVVYLRKPSPNYLGVGDALDEDGVREHIARTARAARGCRLEVIQRDVYTIGHSTEKVRRYVALIREQLDKYWR
ncbi:MAG: hypothetical protein GX558_09305 [Clostridiales bacterium]|nr:hypothetical protein [Clostridiales bacterium]